MSVHFFPQKSHLHERYGVTNGSGMQKEIPKNAAYFFSDVIPLREPPEILESKSGPRKTNHLPYRSLQRRLFTSKLLLPLSRFCSWREGQT